MRYGLGDGTMVDGVYVMDTPITVDTVTPSGENVYQDSTGKVIGTSAGSGSSLSTWLNQNALVVGLGAAALLLFVVVAKAGR